MFCDVFGLEFTFPLKFSKKTSGGELNDIFSLHKKEFIKMAFTLFGSVFFFSILSTFI